MHRNFKCVVACCPNARLPARACRAPVDCCRPALGCHPELAPSPPIVVAPRPVAIPNLPRPRRLLLPQQCACPKVAPKIRMSIQFRATTCASNLTTRVTLVDVSTAVGLQKPITVAPVALSYRSIRYAHVRGQVITNSAQRCDLWQGPAYVSFLRQYTTIYTTRMISTDSAFCVYWRKCCLLVCIHWYNR